MKNFEEESDFDSEDLMENENSDDQNEIKSDPLYFINNNELIYFGFYEKSSNIFYIAEESTSKKFTIIIIKGLIIWKLNIILNIILIQEFYFII